jgi:hypothetical protein
MTFPLRLMLMLGLSVLVVAAPGGCRARGRPAPERVIPASKSSVRPLESRVDAILGRTLVIPVSVSGPVDARAGVVARLEDGRRPECGLYWVCAASGSEVTGWLPEAGAWSATRFNDERRPSERGFWALVIDMPLDSVGQGVWVGDTRIVINWLPDPGSLEGGDEVWGPPLGAPSEGLLRMAQPQARSPLTRWRYHLITTGLRPDARAPLEQDISEPSAGAGDVFPDPVIEALARQTESRWQVGLASLWLADPDLAHRLRRRLVAAVDFGGGVVAPAWPTDEDGLRTLLSDLTNSRLSAARKAERTLNWITSQPEAVAWVIDDAGLRDGVSSATVSTCGIANLTERATLCWPSMGTWTGGDSLTPLESLGVARLGVAPPGWDEPGARGPGRPRLLPITLHAGSWSTQCAVVQGKLPSAPPGVRLEPMALDWTMRSFLAGEPGPEMMPERPWATAALLYRDAPPLETARERGTACWWVYVECRVPKGQEVSAERVRVWIGPTATPVSVVRISASGSVIDERAGMQGRRGEIVGGKVVREEDRWVARVPLPDNITDPDGALRIAIERTDAAGRRSTFPRPQLPWQGEPGRILIDTSTWDRR